MIDLHCHILPGLDDGAAAMSDAIEMARIAVDDGIEIAAATPHAFNGIFDVTYETRDRAIQEFRSCLAEEGIPLEILPGSDCHISEHLLPILKTSPAYSLNETGRAFLLEWPPQLIPAGFREFLFEARIADLKCVLTHPERHPEVQEDPEIIGDLIDSGLHVQIGAHGLMGLFGDEARHTAEKLLSRGWVHVIASDAHDSEIRKPVLSEALARARQIIGSAAVDLVTTNPAELLGLDRERSVC